VRRVNRRLKVRPNQLTKVSLIEVLVQVFEPWKLSKLIIEREMAKVPIEFKAVEMSSID